jgi:hypothetical protein
MLTEEAAWENCLKGALLKRKELITDDQWR